MTIFVGVDWAESHHDVCVKDNSGRTLAKRRVPDGIAGVRQFHELIAPFIEEPAEALIGIETDRGLFVGALVAVGYRVYAVNPFSSSRYRDRHSSSGAKWTTEMPRCWPISCEPTRSIIARWPATPTWPRRSKSWLGATSR